MKNHRLLNIAMVVLFVLATVLFVKMQYSMEMKSPPLSDNGNVIDVPVDATPEEVKDALVQGEDEGKDVVINLDQPPSTDEIAEMESCETLLDQLTVGPPIGDQTFCRTADGQATLLTVALEDSQEWELVGPGEPMRRK